MDIYKRIYELENEIAALPQGSINMKKIYGKEQPYLQWTENGKSKSKYIKKNEREEIFAGVERRKQLQEELKELKQHSSIDPSKSTDFETSVIIGERLLALTKGVKNWGKRDCFRQLQAYLNSEETDRVCLVFGLRRTGKTTMLRQAVLGMTPSQSAKSAYIKAKGSDTMAAMNRDLGKLLDLGYEYVFIDEVTLMPDFIDSAALFSDIYAAQGMKIVLSGTDSLGFWFALHQELYDRAVTIHTTFIPFREHSRLLGIDSARDELPQSAAGRTIMTTEPKFIPEAAVPLQLEGGGECRVRLIDCVGYMVEGAMGHEENDKPRMVKSPWFDHEVPFDLAAETGTRKVICEHSTIGIVVTTDGSVSDIPREGYARTEKRIVEELDALGKPYIILLNSTHPDAPETKQLAEGMARDYDHTVLPVSCVDLDAAALGGILRQVLYEFPVQELDFALPRWVTMLENGHWLQTQVYDAAMQLAAKVSRMKDVPSGTDAPALECDAVQRSAISGIDLANGSVRVRKIHWLNMALPM